MTIHTWRPQVQMHGPVWYVANCSSLWITNWVKFGTKIILFLNVLSILHYELNMRHYKASKKRWLFGHQVHQSPSELFADSMHSRLWPLSGQQVHSSLQTTDWNDHSTKHTVYNSEQVYESRLESVTNGNQHALSYTLSYWKHVTDTFFRGSKKLNLWKINFHNFCVQF